MAFKIFSKFCFLTALLVIKRSTNHQMVMTMPKIPAIKVFTPISLKAFCRSSFVEAFATASSVALVMTIKRIIWARKRASFSTPSQICLVIKLRVYRRLPLDCLGFKLNLPSFTLSAPKMKLSNPKDKVNLRSPIYLLC